LKEKSRKMRTILVNGLAIVFSLVFLWGGESGDTKNGEPEKIKLFSIGGTYRQRGEVQDGYNIRAYGTGTSEDYLLSRLRLDIDFRLASSLGLHAQIQDARALGLSFSDQDFAQANNPYHDPFDINQLYLEYWPAKAVGLKIGRQAISYGDRRVFGPGDWSNTGRYAWDAVRLEINEKSFTSHWLIGRSVLHDPDRWPNVSAPGPTAYASYNTIKSLPFLLSFFFVHKYDGRGLTKGEKGTGNLLSHSAGFKVDGQSGRWDYSAMFAGQFGKWGPDDLRAHGCSSKQLGTKIFRGRRLPSFLSERRGRKCHRSRA